MSERHPPQVELALETLDLLKSFLGELGPMSKRLSEKVQAGEEAELSPLADGVDLLFESVNNIRGALEISGPNVTETLEQELARLLASLADAIEAGQSEEQARILGTLLPEQLEKWQADGIPAILATLPITKS